MFDIRALRYGVVLLAAIAVIATATTPSRAQTGFVRVQVVKAGFIFGVGGGSGVLIYEGRRYPLSVRGISIGATVGASRTELVGRAYNLRRVTDIAGTYTALGGGVAVAAGVAGVRLQNAKGVVLELRGREVGLEIAANLSGVQVNLR
jgi:lipid-binding SYLF domain-containing protein